ncbi:hypothetical protein DXG03_001742 [Asterophora parasitica]|uniref:Uncharacterized protein n=1 Tax=Asterophora parasitica TaxID=117018 RepID=A0A9P7GH55_9AGAR|nr:hypothetical protein DXG03_001742 [Asterophora parasitica]
MLVVTDLPEVRTIDASKIVHRSLFCSGPVYVRPLAWGNASHGVAIASELLTPSNELRTLTHVVCSDLVYFPDLLAPLLRSLLQVTSPPFSTIHSVTNPGATVAIAYKVRSQTKETPFWAAFGLWFTFKPVLVKETSSGKVGWQRLGSSSEDVMFIFVAHRRPESYAWKIPVEDMDLLAGRGARGTDTAKADDTFEILLFMALESDEPEE